MRTSMLNQLLNSVADAGRDMLWSRSNARRRDVETLCRDLLSARGVASGTALAREVVAACAAMDEPRRLAFFTRVADTYGADPEAIVAAARAYQEDRSVDHLLALRRAAEAPRQELFRRMNMAPNGTLGLVRLRSQLLDLLPEHPELREVDADLHHLLSSWFNPGFLTLTRIDWNSPAALLEKLVAYEQVHRMETLEDMRRRLAADRRCFAFFHPALPGEPLIFVEVALTDGLSGMVQPLIDRTAPIGDPAAADTAVFYSINNCQEGLRGVTLGNFLIKLVVANLQDELPQLRYFATLSPVPGFARWLDGELAKPSSPLVEDAERAVLARIAGPESLADPELEPAAKPLLMRLCAHYLAREKRGNNRPRDPVARFHLGNGARLERINWRGDVSTNGFTQSLSLLVNYRYDPGSIERNHEAYTNSGEVITASAVRRLLPELAEAA